MFCLYLVSLGMFNKKKRRCTTDVERILVDVLKEKDGWAIVWFGRSILQKAANGMERRAGKTVECLAGLARFTQLGKVRAISQRRLFSSKKSWWKKGWCWKDIQVQLLGFIKKITFCIFQSKYFCSQSLYRLELVLPKDLNALQTLINVNFSGMWFVLVFSPWLLLF